MIELKGGRTPLLFVIIYKLPCGASPCILLSSEMHRLLHIRFDNPPP